MADAGFRLSVEGEKEFRKAISDINAILKLNQSELKRSVAEYNASEKDMDALTKRHKELEAAITTQIGAISEMSGEYSRLKNEYGENDKGVIKMKGSLDEAAASLAYMQAQFKANAEEIENAAKAAEEMAKATEEMAKAAAAAEELEKVKKAAEESAKTMADADAQIAAFSAELRAIESAAEDGGESLSLFGKKSEETEKKVKLLTEQNELLEKTVEQHKKKLDLLNDEMSEAVKLYGDQSREVAEYRTQIANTQTEVQGLTKKIDANNDEIDKVKKGAISLSDVFSGISDITGVQIPEGLTNVLGGVQLTEKAVAGGLVTALIAAAKKVAEIYKGLLDSAAEIKKLSEETGLDEETLQALQEVADYYKVDFDTLKDSFKDLRNRMYEATTGNEELAKTFEELGVVVENEDGTLRDVLSVYMDLSDAFSEISDKEERLARMEEILGESANQSAQIAAAGKEELSKVINKVYDNFLVRSKETIDQLSEEEKKWDEWGMKIKGWGNIAVETARETANDEWWKKLISAGGLLPIFVRYLTNWDEGIANFATAPAYATGTYNHPGGYALVGERGPEIVDLPAGSRVYPNGEGPAMGTVNYYNITIPASDIREFNDIVRIAQSKRIVDRMK